MAVLITGVHQESNAMVATALMAMGLRTPAGDREDEQFGALSDDVLALVNASWETPPDAGVIAQEVAPPALTGRAEALVAEMDVASTPWGWVDRRASLALPFWQRVVPGLRVIIVVTHPLCLDRPAERRVARGRRLELWQRRISSLLAAVDAEHRLVVDVQAIADDPQGVARLLARYVGLREDRVAAGAAVLASTAQFSVNGDEPDPSAAVYLALRMEALRAVASSIPAPTAVVDGATTGDRMRRLEDAVAQLTSTDEVLRVEIGVLGDRLIRLIEDIQSSLELTADASEAAAGERSAYTQLVRRVREIVRDRVPLDANVAVVSRGDDDLLRLFGRRAGHFPRELGGKYLGYHPKNGLAAVAHLETVRALGVDHLVVPATSSWWFDEYPAFADHLATRSRELDVDPAVCRVFSLAEAPVARATSGVSELIEQMALDGHDATVLDLTVDGRAADSLPPRTTTFAPPVSGVPLPYADHSIPIVAIASADPALRSEARRVAAVAVVDLEHGDVLRLGEVPTALPTVSVIMPVHNHPGLTDAAIRSLLGSLPARFRGELVVIDDGSADQTQLLLEGWATREPAVRVLRNEAAKGYLGAMLRGIEAASGEYLLFVNNDMVFLDGWLEPLLHIFEQFPDAGAAGARLIYPDGRLQEAGGLLFADGTASKFGYLDPDTERAAYNFVRPVDYCSGCLLLTPRAVYDEVGGLDRAFDPGYYEDTEYCLRLRLSGRRIYYQPESIVVHVEGATAGLDPTVGMKRHQLVNHDRFLRKWGDVLARLQPERPDPCDDAALHELVMSYRVATEVSG